MIKLHTKNKRVIDAMKLFNEIYPQLLESILNRPQFDMADCNNQNIVDLLEYCIEDEITTIKVVTYRPLWPWSKALGYVLPNKKTIHLNSRRLDRSNASIVGSIAHELVHIADGITPYSFGHGNNSPKGKGNTAPYWIGRKAKTLSDAYETITLIKKEELK